MPEAELQMVCCLCGAVWHEPRQRGSCPGCGASEGEMLRVAIRDLWKMAPEVIESRKSKRKVGP